MKEVEVTEVTQNGTVHNIESGMTLSVEREWDSSNRKRMTLTDTENNMYTVEIRYNKLCFAPSAANINTFAEFEAR